MDRLIQLRREYRDDYRGLPETGPNSRKGHRRAFESEKRGLKKALSRFKKDHCGDKGRRPYRFQEWVLDLAEGMTSPLFQISDHESQLERLTKWIADRWSWPEVPDGIWWNKKWWEMPAPVPAPGPFPMPVP